MNMKNLFLFAFAFCCFSCTKSDNDFTSEKPLVADFTYSDPAAVNKAVKFQNASANAAAYEWDFGDGTTSREENPVHTYKKIGNYSVILVTYGMPEANVTNDVKIKEVKINSLTQ
jgi:PKD repeat protein